MLPLLTWNRTYSLPRHWRDLAVDSSTWSPAITDEAYVEALSQLDLTPEELHRRLAHYWTVLAGLNTKGANDVAKALSVGPRPSSVEDMEFLETSLRVDKPLLESLADFNRGMARYFATPSNKAAAAQEFQKALGEPNFHGQWLDLGPPTR